MALYINGNKTGGGNANVIRLTQAEYDALPPTKLTDNNVYMITDANGDGSQFQPVIYSENEREIGVWIDGKPLYQKTYTNVSLQNNSDATLETNVSEFEIKDFEIDFIGVSSTVVKLRNCDDSLYVNNNGSLIYWIYASSWYVGLSVANITVRYTKTTDTAGSGTWTPQGVPAVHYSTDEKVVGTWIDGSTLYEKTITFTNITIPKTGVKIGEIEIGDNIVEAQGHVIENGGMVYGIPELDLRWYVDNNDILLLCIYASKWEIDSGDLTIKYTKTSQGGN